MTNQCDEKGRDMTYWGGKDSPPSNTRSSRRPQIEDYRDQVGQYMDAAFKDALIAWQYEEIERLQRIVEQPRIEPRADLLAIAERIRDSAYAAGQCNACTRFDEELRLLREVATAVGEISRASQAPSSESFARDECLCDVGREGTFNIRSDCPVHGKGSAQPPLPDAARDVLAERERQKAVEGWTPEHDDEHRDGAMACAAAAYATPDEFREFREFREVRVPAPPCQPAHAPITGWGPFYKHVPTVWQWAAEWWKPKDRRRDLVRAGALILAEIERMDRHSLTKAGE